MIDPIPGKKIFNRDFRQHRFLNGKIQREVRLNQDGTPIPPRINRNSGFRRSAMTNDCVDFGFVETLMRYLLINGFFTDKDYSH